MIRKSYVWAVVAVVAALTLFFVLGGSSLFLSASIISTSHHLPDLGGILAESAFLSPPTNLFDVAADFEHIFDLPLYHEPVLSLVYESLLEPLQPPRHGLGLDYIYAAAHSIHAFIVWVLRSAELGTAAEYGNTTLKLLSAFYTILREGDWCAVAITLAVLLDLSLLLIRSVRPTRTHVNVARPSPVSALSVGQRKEVLGLVLKGSRVPRAKPRHSAVDARLLHNLFYRSLYLSPYPTVRMGVPLPMLLAPLPFDLLTPLDIRTRLPRVNPATRQLHGTQEGGRVSLTATQPPRASVLTAGRRKEVISLVLARSQPRSTMAVHALVNMGLSYRFRRSIYSITCPTTTTRVYVTLLVAKLLVCLAIRPEGYTHAPVQARLLIEYNQEKDGPVISDDKPEVEVEVEVEIEVEQPTPVVRKAQREPKFVAYVARPLRNAPANSRKTAQEAVTDSLLVRKDRHDQDEQDARRGNPETRLGSLGPGTVGAAPVRPEVVVNGGVEGAPKRKRVHRGKRGKGSRSDRDPRPEL